MENYPVIKNSARRLTLAVTLGLSTVAAVSVARAQTTAPAGKVTTNGVTGTDPVPKGCGCVVQPPPTSNVSTSSTVAQALLVFLGAA
jgi:hypothetical protein